MKDKILRNSKEYQRAVELISRQKDLEAALKILVEDPVFKTDAGSVAVNDDLLARLKKLSAAEVDE